MADIKITKIHTGFAIENDFGKLELTWADFYDLVRIGDHNDALTEIEDYVAQFDDESCVKAFGKDADTILGDKELMDNIARRLIKNRIDAESTDDIYDAVREIC